MTDMRDYLDADLLGIAVSDDQNLALRGAALSEIERRVGSMKRLATRSRSRPRWRPQKATKFAAWAAGFSAFGAIIQAVVAVVQFTK